MSNSEFDQSSADRRLVSLSIMAADLDVRPADLRRDAIAGRVPCIRIGEHSLLFDRDRIRLWLLERAEAEGNNDER